jgi:hypothetical protein
MRRLVALAFATTTLSCSVPQTMPEQAQLPAPIPPPMHAPICARPAERAAVDVSALVSELQLITMTCDTRPQYNALIPHLRPALATKEKNLSAFFSRAYGKRGQTEHDKYITELANLQSQRALKSGDRFCTISTSMFEQVMPLGTVEQLATYTQSKPIQQALSVDECPATPTARGMKDAKRPPVKVAVTKR